MEGTAVGIIRRSCSFGLALNGKISLPKDDYDETTVRSYRFRRLCLFAGANTSLAADHSQVPSQMLASMGLSSMQPMSDSEGLAIRGKGRSVTVQKNTVVIVNVLGSQTNNLSTASFIQVNVKHLNLNLGFLGDN